MSFDSLGLSAPLLRAVEAQGYTVPTAVQAQVIPVILEGRDVMAGSQTGTGKTAGFTLPLLERLMRAPGARRPRSPRALILTPTRELAAQVAESAQTYGQHLPLKSAAIFGGVNINPQISLLRGGVDVLVATPGRLLDHAGQSTVDLSRIEILVLDEADRMLDMGFLPDIRRILKLLPPGRQNLLFSATFADEIRNLADRLLDSPVRIDVAQRNATADGIDQLVHRVEKSRKREVLSSLIRSGDWRQVLVFTRTKHGANRLARQLEQDGLQSAAIHGNKSQAARTRALAEFKSGALRVLVATDIAARGLDIDQLPRVINFELPDVPEYYVHRIGRTGRAGRDGQALSLISEDERKQLTGIEKLLGYRLRQEPAPQSGQSGQSDPRGQRGQLSAPPRRSSSSSVQPPRPAAAPTAPTGGAPRRRSRNRKRRAGLSGSPAPAPA